MRIDFETKPLLKENISSIKEIYSIDEACHAFNGQYESSTYMAEHIYDALMNGKKSLTLNLFLISDGHINNVNVILEKLKNVFYSKFEGEIQNMTTNKDFTFKIFYSDFNLNMSKNNILRELKTTIAHELMHCNIFYTLYDKGKNFNTTPIYYNKVVDTIQNIKENTFLRNFLYAIYSTYYQEAQAITSEVVAEMQPYNKNNIIEKLKQTQGYKIFQRNLEIIENIKNSKQIKIELQKQLLGLNIDAKINKLIKHIEIVSKKAIHNILNNAYFNLK